MHYPIFMPPIIGAIVAPLIWALFATQFSASWMSTVPVFMCWAICVYATYRENQRPRNLFIGSGTSKPAKHSCELILKSKGKGDNFFCSHRSLSFADIQDFRFTRGKEISFEELLKFKPFSIEPYCVDDEHKRIIFVEMPLAFDAAMVGPFYFSTQRQFAQRLFAVPYEEYHAFCERLEDIDMRKLILLYNTSRCGSTLVSKAFDTMAGIQSISEPDMFTSLTHMAAEAKDDPQKLKEIERIARSTGRLLLHLRQRRYPDRPTLALKFRFQVVHISHILKAALPEARSMFLYRNGIDVIDSMGAAFINGGEYKIIRGLGLDVPYIFKFSALPTHLWKLIPLFSDKRFPTEKFQILGAVSPFTLGWLSVMEKALDAKRKGEIDTFFRYEDIVLHQGRLLEKVLKHAGFDPVLDDTTAMIFKKDSQKNNVASSSRRDAKTGKVSSSYAYLKSFDLKHIKQVISMHPEINESDYIIPGTIQIDA